MRSARCACFLPSLAGCCLLLLLLGSAAGSPGQDGAMELSRPIRPWEFLSTVGMRSALLGNEAGHFEAWVYPLKILRDFHLLFRTQGRRFAAESLARTLTVRPESCTIVYAGDTFQVRETLFAPIEAPGVVISIEVQAAESLEVEAAFQRDFQLEWPAALGGTYMNWDPSLHAFYLGEEQKKFVALVGSPTAVLEDMEYATNYSASSQSSFLLGPTLKARETKVVIIAASVAGRAEAENTYHRLATNYAGLLTESAAYYRAYLDRTVNLQLPDPQLQQAYAWARISMIQGLVANPYLGTGLIAGYRTSAESQRPGFAWFFGRDALWTTLAFDAAGDFATSHKALEFLSNYQRSDGKIAHEISQSASFIDWFKAFGYPYASADATPLYIIAIDDYVMHSGDLEFARQKWNSLWKAYQFLRSTYDSQGLPQNFGFGHGWVEGGPLLPVKSELYQSAVGAEALRALSNLAHLVGKEDVSRDLAQDFAGHRALLNQAFWSGKKKLFGFGLDQNNQTAEVASVLSTVPMWFGLLEEQKSQATLNLLTDSDHQADWGMRIISSRDSRYNPGGYHFGSVWPLFTGWASVGEYRYHRALAGYSNLRANALLGLDGSLGHFTEVLSGDYYQTLSTASPHQIWSAAMVVGPVLRGMLGIDVNAFSHQVVLAPHLPYGWNSLAISNLRVGSLALRLVYRRTDEWITLQLTRSGEGECVFDFLPSLSLRAHLLEAELNGHKVAFDIEKNTVDQHVRVHFTVSNGSNLLRLRVRDDFGLALAPRLPPLGSRSEGLRVVSELWSGDLHALIIDLAGRAGHRYEFGVWNPEQVLAVEGATLKKDGAPANLEVLFPGSPDQDYVHSKVVIHFQR